MNLWGVRNNKWNGFAIRPGTEGLKQKGSLWLSSRVWGKGEKVGRLGDYSQPGLGQSGHKMTIPIRCETTECRADKDRTGEEALLKIRAHVASQPVKRRNRICALTFPENGEGSARGQATSSQTSPEGRGGTRKGLGGNRDNPACRLLDQQGFLDIHL